MRIDGLRHAPTLRAWTLVGIFCVDAHMTLLYLRCSRRCALGFDTWRCMAFGSGCAQEHAPRHTGSRNDNYPTRLIPHTSVGSGRFAETAPLCPFCCGVLLLHLALPRTAAAADRLLLPPCCLRGAHTRTLNLACCRRHLYRLCSCKTVRYRPSASIGVRAGCACQHLRAFATARVLPTTADSGAAPYRAVFWFRAIVAGQERIWTLDISLNVWRVHQHTFGFRALLLS